MSRILKEDYQPTVEAFPVELPAIPSGEAYYFKSASGLRYQVLFARKKSNYLANIINFSVLDDAFENEYSETNRGEVYRVITTVVEIMRTYHEQHPLSTSYEFSGEFKEGNEQRKVSIRTRLYHRVAGSLLAPGWKLELKENRVVITRI